VAAQELDLVRSDHTADVCADPMPLGKTRAHRDVALIAAPIGLATVVPEGERVGEHERRADVTGQAASDCYRSARASGRVDGADDRAEPTTVVNTGRNEDNCRTVAGSTQLVVQPAQEVDGVDVLTRRLREGVGPSRRRS